MTPVKFMKSLMNTLKMQDYSLDGFDYALDVTTSGKYKTWNSLISEISSAIDNNKTEKDGKNFLLSSCNIDLDNEDVGSLLGYDASGGQIANENAVIKETGSISSPDGNTFKIGGITFSTDSNLSAKDKNLVNILYTWCIPLAIEKVTNSYGLSVTDSSFCTDMPIKFFSDPAAIGKATTFAYVEAYLYDETSGGHLHTFELDVNDDDTVYGDAVDGDDASKYGTHVLDTTIAHEFTHALMATNMSIYGKLPKWFIEGSAELVVGCDATRSGAILATSYNSSKYMEGIKDTTFDGVQKYTSGYITLRYLLRKLATDKEENNDAYESPSNCVYTLKELTNKIKSFLTSDYNGTIPWEIVNDNIDKTDSMRMFHPFGTTFKIPNGNNPAFLSVNWEQLNVGQYQFIPEENSDYFFETVWDRDQECYIGADEWGDPIMSHTHYVWKRNEILKDSGEYLFFSLHIKQENGLYSYEQGGSSTEYESYTDIVPTGAYNLLPLHDTISALCLKQDVFREPKRVPGMGSAILAIANKNKGDADYRCIEYWMTKTDRSATVTIRVNKKYYQSVTFGFLDHADERVYPYPLYIGGGIQALAPDVYTYTGINGGCPQHKYGNVFSSDIKNKAFVNGNILNICKFNGANCTNFRVRRPSGIWDNYNNFIQTASRTDLYTCPSCGGYGQCYEPQFKYDINPPAMDMASTARIYPRDIGFNLHEVRTTAINKDSLYTYNNKLDQMQIIPTDNYTTDINPPIQQKMDISTPLFPILPYLTHHIENYAIKDSASANGVMGQVPNQYAIWDKSGRHGVNKLGDREFLLVPAGYPERLISYPGMNSVINWFPHEEEIKSWYDNIYTDSNMIYSTVAIDLSITITLELLKKYVIIDDKKGNSFSFYNDRLYYVNDTATENAYYMAYYDIDMVTDKGISEDGKMYVIASDKYSHIATIAEIDGSKNGKSNILKTESRR